MYINNIAKLENFEGHWVSYADDTAVVFVGNCWDTVYQNAEESLASIYKRLNSSLLSLNTQKSKFLTFTLYKNDQPHRNTIIIHNNLCPNQVNCN